MPKINGFFVGVSAGTSLGKGRVLVFEKKEVRRNWRKILRYAGGDWGRGGGYGDQMFTVRLNVCICCKLLKLIG